MKPLKRAVVIGCLLLFATGYPTGYFFARTTHQIVHARAYTYDAHGHQITSEHWVHAGDYKFGYFAALCSLVFTPLRAVEFLMWQIIEPIGKPFGLP
ncbi:MAG: hypothetical protein QM817_07805 [Archangium sp.]